jgi:hypothetical protein
VLTTATNSGQPEAALVGFAVTPVLEIIFDTVRSSRKYPNLKENPRVACGGLYDGNHRAIGRRGGRTGRGCVGEIQTDLFPEIYGWAGAGELGRHNVFCGAAELGEV